MRYAKTRRRGLQRLETAAKSEPAPNVVADARDLARSLSANSTSRYFNGTVNGEFDPATRAALSAFANSYRSKCPISYLLDAIEAVRGIDRPVALWFARTVRDFG